MNWQVEDDEDDTPPAPPADENSDHDHDGGDDPDDHDEDDEVIALSDDEVAADELEQMDELLGMEAEVESQPLVAIDPVETPESPEPNIEDFPDLDTREVSEPPLEDASNLDNATVLYDEDLRPLSSIASPSHVEKPSAKIEEKKHVFEISDSPCKDAALSGGHDPTELDLVQDKLRMLKQLQRSRTVYQLLGMCHVPCVQSMYAPLASRSHFFASCSIVNCSI